MFDNPIYEIMQFTWLLDKSWKEIYEGYVIQVYIEGYLQNKPYIVEDIFTCHNWLNNQDSYYRWDNNIEIIGNIYQNPELLK